MKITTTIRPRLQGLLIALAVAAAPVMLTACDTTTSQSKSSTTKTTETPTEKVKTTETTEKKTERTPK